MTPKARHLRNSPHDRTISVDELFAAAFKKSKVYYMRESLLGWRPVAEDCEWDEVEDEPDIPAEEELPTSHSPDVTVNETSDFIFIEVNLPDIDEDSLFLEISGDLLMIKAERADAGNHDGGNGSSDRSKVHRYVKLPIAAQPGNVQARLEANNVLRVIVHKQWTGLNKADEEV